MTKETEAQTRTRSALGGFERDAKTFEGHLQRITASAEAFVKRCAKFAITDPDHPRLAETAALLAEAKRITGQSESSTEAAETKRGLETWQLADALRGLADRMHLLERRTESIIGHMGGDLAMIDGEPISLPSLALASPALAEAYASGDAKDPLAALAPDARNRVQAALDAAAARRAEDETPAPGPPSPFASAAPAAAPHPR
jgi:hypothetical protein